MNYLYEAIAPGDTALRKKLEDIEASVTAFSRFTTVPVTFYSPAFEILWETGRTSKFCVTNASYENPCSKCRRKLSEAMQLAADHPQHHTFLCATGLVNICFALHHEDELIGFFLAGPVAMGKDSARAIADFYEKVQQENIDIPLLMTMTNNLNVYTPDDVENLSKIFHDILAASASSSEKNSQAAEGPQSPGGALPSFRPEPILAYEGTSDVIYNALRYISQHFRTISGMREIADYVHVSDSYFSTLFRRETGISSVEYLHRIRLQAAVWELENTDSSITDIALSVGFRESSYFSRLFREEYGLSPREYRHLKDDRP